MPIIRGKKPDGQNCMQIVREDNREETIKEMIEDGYEIIQDAETLENYN